MSSKYHVSAKSFLSVVLPFVLFVLHSWLFINWIIDDAGISFAYSRSLAQGYGLVSQPGMNLVEGFSNLSWVLLMSLFFVTKTFDPITTPKIVSIFLIFLSFITIHKTLRLASMYYNLSTFFVLTFLSMNTSFVIWTTSGLENPLFVLLLSLILYQIIKFGLDPNKLRIVTYISILSALCALTRPDGLLYSIAFPLLACKLIAKLGQASKYFKFISIYAGVFLLVFGSYIAFRYAYFGDLFPNTYYAKGETVSLLLGQLIPKMIKLPASIGLNAYLADCLLIMFIFIIINNKNTFRYDTLIIICTLLFIAALSYILLPHDWMGEFRFATPFFVFFYIFMYLIGEMVYEQVQMKKAVAILFAFLIIIFASSSALAYSKRSINFANSPVVPFTLIAERYGNRFDNYALVLGIKNGSVLLPDLGGTLYYSRLKVYDLAGLTDKVIGKSLGRNQNIFHDYVFESIKPTFIHSHKIWAYLADFDADPRFRKNYVPINETQDIWILENKNISMCSGDYVRKDSIKNFAALKNLQADLTECPNSASFDANK